MSETPMTGRISSDGILPELLHVAKLVLYERQSTGTERYLAHTQSMVDSKNTVREAQATTAKLLAGYFDLEPVAETLRSWKTELTAVTLSKKVPETVKILLYGSTGEGKSALVSALLDMPGIAPSDCAGSAVTSCTMIYNYRAHTEKEAKKPDSKEPAGWAQWLSQIALPPRDRASTGPCKYGATLHFLSPLAFSEQRKQLVDSIGDYWLNERREGTIQARLPHDDQHDAYFAIQTLLEWYGDHVFSVKGWRTRADLMKHLEQKDSQIEGLKMVLGKCQGPNITFQEGTIYVLEQDDPSVFCEELREWVTVSKKYAPFLSHVDVYLPNETLKGVTLIDAAGLGDDNRQRREKAEGLVQSADFVWVLATLGIKRQTHRLSLTEH